MRRSTRCGVRSDSTRLSYAEHGSCRTSAARWRAIQAAIATAKCLPAWPNCLGRVSHSCNAEVTRARALAFVSVTVHDASEHFNTRGGEQCV